MTILNSLFLVAVTLIASFLSLQGILVEVGLPARIFQILFAPITIYLIFRLARHATAHLPVFSPPGNQSGLAVYCLIVSAILVTIGFTSAQSTAQFVGSLAFSPLVVYFFVLIWPRPNSVLQTTGPQASGTGIRLDMDRRNFLKLLGSVGLLALLSGLFSKRADFLFPYPDRSRDPDSTASEQSSPTAGYLVTQVDDSEIAYFGFTNKLGSWFIMKQDTDNSYRYIRGDRDFSSNWTNRSTLKYNYFEEVF